MIDIASFLDSFDESLDDGRDHQDKYDVAVRLLCSTARRYNNIYAELERLKESTGFNKPFPFLRLPRELRDKIYTYALRATISVDVIPRLPCFPTAENPFKPPTSGLLRVNKQIYHEAIETLYSKNTFRFQEPGELSAFEQHIGSENHNRVRSIYIWVRFLKYRNMVPDPTYVPRSQYDSVPSLWSAALKACGLGQIVHLNVEADMILSGPCTLLSMPKNLQESIEEFLGRAVSDRVPQLSLTGFREEERDKFPKRWEIVMDQWNDYKEEVEDMRTQMEEMDTDSDTQSALDPGSSEDGEEVDDEHYLL